MRKILFRGKSTDTGAWVYGYYCGPFGDFDEHEICDIADPTCSRVYVDPETVGQYTGLTDKNGKRIFEGDIIHARCAEDGNLAGGFVNFTNGCFCVCYFGNNPAIDLLEKYEVIGNVHDNPELIGGKEDGT